MSDINIKWVSENDFKNLVTQSEAILKNSKEIAKQFEGVSKKGMSADMAKLAEMEKKLVILAEKKRQEEEKTRKLSEIANQQASKQLIIQEKINQEKARSSAQDKKTEYQLQQIAHKQQQLNEKIKTGGKDMRGWGDALNSFQFKFNFLGNAIANLLTSVTSGMKEFAKSSVQAFIVQENADRKLLQSLNNNVLALDRLKAKASEFQKRGVVGDEVIEQQMAFLGVQGRTEAQITKTIEAALALSRVTGDDLQSAVKKVDQTFEGSIGRLGKLDSGFKSLTKEQLMNGEAVDMIIEKYGKMIDAVSTEDKIKQMENAWGDLKEQFGGFSANILNNVLPSLTKYFEDLSSYMEMTSEAIARLFGKQVSETDALRNLNKMSAEERVKYFKTMMANMTTEQQKIEFTNRLIKTQIKLNDGANGKTSQSDILTKINFLEALKKREKDIVEIKQEAIKLQKLDISYYDKEEKKAQEAKKAQFEFYYALHRTMGYTHEDAKKLAEEYDKVKENIGKFEKDYKKLSEETKPSSDKNPIKNLGDAYHTFLLTLKKGGSIRDALKKALNIDDEQIDSLKDGFNTALNAYTSFIDAKTEIAKQDVQNSTNRISELQNLLQAEIQLNQQGYASNIQGRMAQIEAEEQTRQKALQQQAKYQKQSAIIDSAQMVASTAVSVANIFKVWSGVPFVGPLLAGVQIGAMLLQIAASQQKARSLAKFGDGGLIGGRKHSQGGTVIEAEKGEYIVNADSTGEYFNTIKDINDKANPEKIMKSLLFDTSKKKVGDRDVLLRILDKFPDKNKKEIYEVNGKIVERWGNTIRYYQ